MTGTDINYDIAGDPFTGYLSLPDGEPRGGVIVVQEWWGINEHIKSRADALASMGYAAFAVDMYGSANRADTPDEAGAFMGEALGTEGAIGARFQAGIDQLQAASGLGANQLAAIGYCFGGAVVLGMARAGMNLRGVASFHGALGTETPAEAGAVKARIKVYHGNEDSMVDDSQVAAFKAEMDAAGADYEFVGYDGAGHGFTNPGADEKFEKFGLGVAYNQDVAEDSWNRLAGFLDELFAD